MARTIKTTIQKTAEGDLYHVTFGEDYCPKLGPRLEKTIVLTKEEKETVITSLKAIDVFQPG